MLLHHEEFGDRLLGVIAGYLLYAGLVDEGPHAIVAASGSPAASSARPVARSSRSRSTSTSCVRRAPPARTPDPMGTIIVIAGLRELGVHGVLPEEQSRPQPFEVDVELEVDLAPAGQSDDLDDTVDYSAVVRGGEPGGQERALPAARAARDPDRRGVPDRRPGAARSP